MMLTREIVKDLLPLYVAGEASPDSQAAVKAFLSTDAELTRLAQALCSDSPMGATSAPSSVLSADRTVLAATQQLVKRRTWTLALALFFTGLPFSFAFDRDGLRFLFLRDAPLAAGAFFAMAAGLWVAFGLTASRLRVRGL